MTFEYLKKNEPDSNFVIAAVEAAIILRGIEMQNGGLYTDPETLVKTTNGVIKSRNIHMHDSLKKLTHTCVMKFLMDQSFVDGLIVRASNGPIGILSKSDEKEIERILGKLFEKIEATLKESSR